MVTLSEACTDGGGLSARYFVIGAGFPGTAKFAQGSIQMVRLFMGSGPGRGLGGERQPDFGTFSDTDSGSKGK